jgi:hypothetical protein
MVTSSGSDLEGAARLLLTVHLIEIVVGQVRVASHRGLRRRLGLDWLLVRDVCDDSSEVRAGNHLEPIDQCGFHCVGCGHEDSLETMPAEPTRSNQHSVDMAHSAVKGELAQECGARRRGPTHHRQGDGDRHW